MTNDEFLNSIPEASSSNDDYLASIPDVDAPEVEVPKVEAPKVEPKREPPREYVRNRTVWDMSPEQRKKAGIDYSQLLMPGDSTNPPSDVVADNGIKTPMPTPQDFISPRMDEVSLKPESVQAEDAKKIEELDKKVDAEKVEWYKRKQKEAEEAAARVDSWMKENPDATVAPFNYEDVKKQLFDPEPNWEGIKKDGRAEIEHGELGPIVLALEESGVPILTGAEALEDLTGGKKRERGFLESWELNRAASTGLRNQGGTQFARDITPFFGQILAADDEGIAGRIHEFLGSKDLKSYARHALGARHAQVYGFLNNLAKNASGGKVSLQWKRGESETDYFNRAKWTLLPLMVELLKNKAAANEELQKTTPGLMEEIVTPAVSSARVMGEIAIATALTGGLGGGAATAGSAAATTAARMTAKELGKRIFVGALKGTAKALPASALQAIPHAQRMSQGGINLENGKLVETKGDEYSYLKSLGTAIAQNFVETTLFQPLEGAAGKFFKHLRKSKSGIAQSIGNIGKNAIKIGEYTGYGSMPTELLEENAGVFLSDILGLDKTSAEYKGFLKEWEDAWSEGGAYTLEGQRKIVYGMLLISGAKAASSAAYTKVKANKADKNIKSDLIDAGMSKEDVEALTAKQRAVLKRLKDRFDDPLKLGEALKRVDKKLADKVDKYLKSDIPKLEQAIREIGGEDPTGFTFQYKRGDDEQYHADYVEKEYQDPETGETRIRHEMYDPRSGITLIAYKDDKGYDVGYEVINELRPDENYESNSFEGAKRAADHMALDNQRKRLSNNKKRDYANYALAGKQKNFVRYSDSVLDVYNMLTEAFERGETIFGIKNIGQVFVTDKDGNVVYPPQLLEGNKDPVIECPDGTIIPILDNINSTEEMDVVLGLKPKTTTQKETANETRTDETQQKPEQAQSVTPPAGEEARPVEAGEATPEVGGEVEAPILSGDEVRKTMPGYDPKNWRTHIDRKGDFVAPRMEARFQELLKTRKGKGNGEVVFLAGGNGSGKSTVANALGETPDFIIDSTLGNLAVAKKQIETVIANGQKVVIDFVYRSPEQALEGVVGRVKNGGHAVSPVSFADSHTKGIKNLRLLADEYGAKISIRIFDNSVEGQPEISLEQLEAKGIPNYEELRKRANEVLGQYDGRGLAVESDKNRTSESSGGSEKAQSGSKERVEAPTGAPTETQANTPQATAESAEGGSQATETTTATPTPPVVLDPSTSEADKLIAAEDTSVQSDQTLLGLRENFNKSKNQKLKNHLLSQIQRRIAIVKKEQAEAQTKAEATPEAPATAEAAPTTTPTTPVSTPTTTPENTPTPSTPTAEQQEETPATTPTTEEEETEVLPSFMEGEEETPIPEESSVDQPVVEEPSKSKPTKRLKTAKGIDPTAIPSKKTKTKKLVDFPDSLEKYSELQSRLLRVGEKGGVAYDSPLGKRVREEIARMDEAGWGDIYKAQMDWAGSPKETRGEQPPKTPAEFAEWRKAHPVSTPTNVDNTPQTNYNATQTVAEGTNNEGQQTQETSAEDSQDEFRRLQETSRGMSEDERALYRRGSRRLDERDLGRADGERGKGRTGRIVDVLRRRIAASNNGANLSGVKTLTVKGKDGSVKERFKFGQVDGQTFRDVFEVARNYLENGELVDLHDTYGDDVKCFLSEDGLCGFAVESDGNLVSVFSLRKGSLRAMKDMIKKAGATHLDAYASKNQDLATIYSKVLGFKVASRMDYNMDYDHDNIAANHGNPDVVFMYLPQTEKALSERRFNKDSYDAAVAYQKRLKDTKLKKGGQKKSESQKLAESIKGNVAKAKAVYDKVRANDPNAKLDPFKFRKTQGNNNGLSLSELKALAENVGKEEFVELGLTEQQAEELASAIQEAYAEQNMATPNASSKAENEGKVTYSVGAMKALDAMRRKPDDAKAIANALRRVSDALEAAKRQNENAVESTDIDELSKAVTFWEGKYVKVLEALNALPKEKQDQVIKIKNKLESQRDTADNKGTVSINAGANGGDVDIADTNAGVPGESVDVAEQSSDEAATAIGEQAMQEAYADEGEVKSTGASKGATGRKGGSRGGNNLIKIKSVDGDSITIELYDVVDEDKMGRKRDEKTIPRAMWSQFVALDTMEGEFVKDSAKPQVGDTVRMSAPNMEAKEERDKRFAQDKNYQTWLKRQKANDSERMRERYEQEGTKVAANLGRNFIGGVKKVNVVDRLYIPAIDGGDTQNIRDPKTQQVVGIWNRKTQELTLFRGANASTLVHELGGHAAYQLAQEQAAKGDKTLLNKMNECIDYALTNPKMKPLIDDIRSRYPNATEEVMRDEIFAALMERNSPIMQNLTKTLQGKAWYNRAWQAIKDAFKTILTKMGLNKADMRGIDNMQPEELMSWLDRTMAEGKNLGALAGMNLGDKSDGTRKMQVGELGSWALGKTADRAKEMELQGASRREIWDETGWWKGRDGMWRFEIPDPNALKMTKDNIKALRQRINEKGFVSMRLGNLKGANDLLVAHPDLADVTISIVPDKDVGGAEGYYDEVTDRIIISRRLLNNLQSFNSTLIHEIQHAVQAREMFDRGSSLDIDALNNVTTQEEWMSTVNKYLNSAGEAEARLTEARRNMTPEERRATPPWEMYDVAEIEQIVGGENRGVSQALGPIKGNELAKRLIANAPEGGYNFSQFTKDVVNTLVRGGTVTKKLPGFENKTLVIKSPVSSIGQRNIDYSALKHNWETGNPYSGAYTWEEFNEAFKDENLKKAVSYPDKDYRDQEDIVWTVNYPAKDGKPAYTLKWRLVRKTKSGEMVNLFTDRREGVQPILNKKSPEGEHSSPTPESVAGSSGSRNLNISSGDASSITESTPNDNGVRAATVPASTVTRSTFMDDVQSKGEKIKEDFVDSTAPIQSAQKEVDMADKARGGTGVEEVVNPDGSTDWLNSTDYVNAKDKENGHLERNLRELQTQYVEPMMKTLARANKPNMKSGELVDDFNLFLQCKHAEARNRKIAADRKETYTDDYYQGMGMVVNDNGTTVGLSKNEADRILASMRAKYGAEFKYFEDAAQYVYDMLAADLDNRYQSGLFSDEEYLKYTDRRSTQDWDTYVPLKDDLKNLYGDDYYAVASNIKRNEFMRARGRGESAIASSPLAAAILQAEQGIRRSSRNILANVEANLVAMMNGGFQKNGLTDFSTTERVNVDLVTGDQTGAPIYAEVVEGVDLSRGGTEYRFTFGDGETATVTGGTPNVAKDPTIHLFKRDGKLYAIRYHRGANGRGETIAKAFGGDNMANWGKGKASLIPAATRWLSAMRTQYSPEFMVTNMLTDNWEALKGLVGKYGIRDGGKVFARNIRNQVANAKDLWHYVNTGEARGVVKKAVDAGLLTKGGVASEGIEGETMKLKSDLAKFIRQQKRLTQMSPTEMAKSAGRNVLDFISLANSFAELSTRIGIFEALEHYGVSTPDAIKYARDATVNFNRKGAKMPIINGLYMFANASVQGLMRTLQAFRDDFKKGPDTGLGSKKIRGGLTSTLILIGVAKAILDNAFGGDDDDEKNAENQSEYERKSYLGIPIGGSKQLTLLRERGLYAAVPYLAQTFTRYAMGNISGKDAANIVASEIATQLTEVVGGNGLFDSNGQIDKSLAMQSVAPTIADMFIQLGSGKDFKGDDILRKTFENNPVKAYNGKDSTPGAYKAVAKALNWISGGNEREPGFLNVAPEELKLITEFIGGGPFRDVINAGSTVGSIATGDSENLLKNFPVARRVVREYPDNTSRYYDAVEKYRVKEILSDYKKLGSTSDRTKLRTDYPWLKDSGKIGDRMKLIDELRHLEKGEVKNGRNWVKPKQERSAEKKAEYKARRLKLQKEVLELLGK